MRGLGEGREELRPTSGDGKTRGGENQEASQSKSLYPYRKI